MANARGHINGATVFSVVYTAGAGYALGALKQLDHFEVPELVAYGAMMVGLGVLFGLWPDVDTNSKGQKVFYWLFFVIDLALILAQNFQAAAYLGLFSILPTLSKHRGWTHTWWAMLLVPSPLFLLPYFTGHVPVLYSPLLGALFYGAAVVGYWSHLVLDGIFFADYIKANRRKVRKIQETFGVETVIIENKAAETFGEMLKSVLAFLWHLMLAPFRAATDAEGQAPELPADFEWKHPELNKAVSKAPPMQAKAPLSIQIHAPPNASSTASHARFAPQEVSNLPTNPQPIPQTAATPSSAQAFNPYEPYPSGYPSVRDTIQAS